MLVSRGGYPTSALIARGNDYPGNFSHVGLVYVDSATNEISVIEAHIEVGVAITTAEGYLADKKLRLMVLRPRADLPALVADPMLPHRAAGKILARARAEHIPYDFAMDYGDPSGLFCSEVASTVYKDEGVTLWMGLSTISRLGIRTWLAELGVKHFETQEPSDLEYDPQLVVVAEWRDPVDLKQDHLDNAVLDAMLEGADQGVELTYPWYKLPARAAGQGVQLGAGAPRRARADPRRDVVLVRAQSRCLRDSAAGAGGQGAGGSGLDHRCSGLPTVLLDARRPGHPRHAGRFPQPSPLSRGMLRGYPPSIAG